MIALDTNVLARLLLEDEPDQGRRARRLLADESAAFWVPVSVVLELAWVLRKSGLGRQAIAAAVRRLLALPRMRLQSPDALAAAARCLVVLEHSSSILKGNPLGDPHVRKLGVWLPPQYDEGTKRRFPVLYDLVGFTALRGNQYVNSSAIGDYADYLTREIIPGSFMPVSDTG